MATDYLRLIAAIKRSQQPLTPNNGDLQGGKVMATDYLCLIVAIKRSRRPLKRLTMAEGRGRGGEGRGNNLAQ